MMEKNRKRTAAATRDRGNLLAACILGGLATLSTFSCAHNSESQGANAPSGMAGGDNTSMGTGGTGATGGTGGVDNNPAGTDTNNTGGTVGTGAPTQ